MNNITSRTILTSTPSVIMFNLTSKVIQPSFITKTTTSSSRYASIETSLSSLIDVPSRSLYKFTKTTSDEMYFTPNSNQNTDTNTGVLHPLYYVLYTVFCILVIWFICHVIYKHCIES